MPDGRLLLAIVALGSFRETLMCHSARLFVVRALSSLRLGVVGHLARRLLRARARGDGTGRKRGGKVNWPSVCLSPAGSHGNGLSRVPHANTGVHSNMSDVSVQATVSFIITFCKKNVAFDILSSVADRLGSFLCETTSHLAVIGASALPRIPGR